MATLQKAALGIQEGESIEQAAEAWARWCEARGNRMLANFLREASAQPVQPEHPVGGGDNFGPDKAGCCGATVTRRCNNCPHTTKE